jgi:acyl dehydratase
VTRCWEDFAAGQVHDLGSVTMERDAIVAFAEQFDPQPFHLSEESARDTAFGELIASGWHTAAVFVGLYADTLLRDAASYGSPGVEELRWWRPVGPGDVLTGRLEVLKVTPSSRRADRGTVRFRGELRNEAAEVALSLVARGPFGRRISAS